MPIMSQFIWNKHTEGYYIDGDELRGRGIATPYDVFQIGGQPGRASFHFIADAERIDGMPTDAAVIECANRFGLTTNDPFYEELHHWKLLINDVNLLVKMWENERIEEIADILRCGANKRPKINFVYRVSITYLYVPDEKKYRFNIVPENIRQAILIQLLDSVFNGLHVKRCLWCNSSFSYGRGTARRETSIYCSPKCQKAHIRHKQGEHQQ